MLVLVCAFRLHACVRDEVVHDVVTDCGCARGVLHILAWIGVGTRVLRVARTRTWTAHWRQHSQYTINISVSFLRAHVMQHVFEGTGKCKIKARGVDVHAMWCSSPPAPVIQCCTSLTRALFSTPPVPTLRAGGRGSD